MRDILRSAGKSLGQAFASNEYFTRWAREHTTIVAWLRARLTRSKSYGLRFSLGTAVSVVGLLSFLNLVTNIIGASPLVAADVRIMNLVAALRTSFTAEVLLLFTYLGDWKIILSLGLVVVIVLWLVKQQRRAVLFVGAVVGGALAYTVIKLLIHRARPDIGFALVERTGYSFPSGHATTAAVFYGLLGYFGYKLLPRRWQKVLVVFLSLVVVFLIGLSRPYLGVHWMSDVLGGWLLGFTILTFALTLGGQLMSPAVEAEPAIAYTPRFVATIVISLLILEGLFIYFYYHQRPLVAQPTRNEPMKVAIVSRVDLERTIAGNGFPKFSETLIGQPMEPISLMVVATHLQLVQAFTAAGWLMADEPQVGTWDELAVAAFFNRSYPTAPVTPSFLDAEPNSLAFEKPTPANTVRQRHHVRFWPTKFSVQGIPVWVATASFDDGLRYFITHKIKPEIDVERDLIKSELAATGLTNAIKQVQLVPPMLGKNQSQDLFFTDGKAYIIWLK